MRKYRKTKKRKRNYLTFLWIIPTLILIIFLIFSSIKIEKKKAVLSEQVENLRKEVERAEKENALLKEAEKEGKSSFYVEKILREGGLYKKKGEKVAVILGNPPKEIQAEIGEHKSFWERFLNKLNLRQ